MRFRFSWLPFPFAFGINRLILAGLSAGLPLLVKKEELAQLVGASRETVNKALADFASRGWVKLEPRAVVVLDYERLSKRGR